MKKPLLDVIFASYKRMEVLLLLHNGTEEIGDILTSLKTNRQSLLPQMRILEEHYIISHDKDAYKLTTIGKLIVDNMVSLVNTTEALDIDIDFWGTHNLDFIPSDLMSIISKLKRCGILAPDLTDLYNEYIQFQEFSKNSRSVYVITEFLFPNYMELFSELISNNVNVYFILSPSLYKKVKISASNEFEQIMQSEQVRFFVYKQEPGFLSFGLNDYSVIMRLLRTDNEPDTKFIWCKNADALEWAKELFDHYLKDSTPISEI